MRRTDDTARDELEAEVKALCDRGDHAAATTLAVRGFGPEILGFLVATHRSDQDAGEVFSAVAEGLWRNLPRFGWDSTLRTWIYAIARNVSLTHRRDAGRRARRGDRPGGASQLEDVAVAVRTETLAFLRTEKRTRLVALRDALEPDDRALLILRVDRKLAWSDIARVLAGAEAPLEAAALLREAARLRKRFQLVKEQLHAAARREGLLGGDD